MKSSRRQLLQILLVATLIAPAGALAKTKPASAAKAASAGCASDCAEKLAKARAGLDTKKKPSEQLDALHDAYETLQAAVNAQMKRKGHVVDAALAKPLFDLALALLKIDPSMEASQALYPLYKANEKAFGKLIDAQPKADRDLLDVSFGLQEQEGSQ